MADSGNDLETVQSEVPAERLRDPHVVALRYRLVPGPRATFAADAPAREFEFHGFDARLDGGMLILSPRGHFADKDRARKAVEPHLRAWETSEMLTTGRLEFSFRFDGLSAIDRDPQPGGPRAMSVAVSSVVHIEDATSTHVTPSSYVSPPAQPVSLKPELSDVVSRWRLLMDGREDLLGVAYFVLSFLRNHYGGGRGRSATTTPGFIELGNRE